MSRLDTLRPVLNASLETAPAPPTLFPQPDADGGLMQRAGFALFCILEISGYANEFAMRIFHGKAYISMVAWVLLPALLVLSGNLLRGLRDVTGRLWLGFLVWVTLAVPLSIWKGGSVALLISYIPHSWMQLYYYAAFVISLRYCRRLMLFLIASNFLLLLDCFLFGAAINGRFEIQQSTFFNNANDLALQLLIAITQFMFLCYQRETWKRVLGGAAAMVALMYLIRTGSRGAFLAVVVLACVILMFAKNRIKLVMIGVPIAAAALLLVPSPFFHRLTLIGPQSQSLDVTGPEDESAAASQTERMALLGQSVMYALKHPLFGVGPGQFAVAASADAAKEGYRAAWLGTHNSYTEVASECGIPAFLLYVGVIAVTLVSNFRTIRRTAHFTEFSDLRALAFCTFNAMLVYAICTFFFHIAYSGYLPAIAGMSVALRLAAPLGRRICQPPIRRST